MVAPTPITRSPPGRERRTITRRYLIASVIGLTCCLFLLPLMASILFQELQLALANQQAQWEPLEPASLSRLRPPRLREQVPNDNNNNERGTSPNAYFNGFPVYLHTDHSTEESETPHSNVHCVGENYEEDAWMLRSCHFSMLCYDLQERDFVLFRSHREEVLSRFLKARPAIGASSAMVPFANETTGVALGGINQKWQLKTDQPPSSKSFKWFPRVLNATPGTLTYYALPSNSVMVPYHSLSAKNPGHLVWDDFLPIYTLLTMFQLQNRIILPLRVTLPERLWSSCEMNYDSEERCQQMTQKFASLLVGRNYPYAMTTADQVQFQLASSDHGGPPASNYVCAPHGAAGLGALTDHGTRKLHGWMRSDYKITHNHGRGAMLYEFRNFMLDNLRVPIRSAASLRPHRIVFSLSSSDIPSRDLNFQHQIATLQQRYLEDDTVQVEAHTLKDMTVQEQVELASETAIFITICGGGAVTGMFLPKGASVILYYLEHGGVEYGVQTGSHAHLDWDLFNHLSHVRAHWMPTATMDNRVDLRALVLLVEQEMDLMRNDVLL